MGEGELWGLCYMANNVRQFLRSYALLLLPEGNANFKSIFVGNKGRKKEQQKWGKTRSVQLFVLMELGSLWSWLAEIL